MAPINGSLGYWGLGIMPNYLSVRNFGMLTIAAAQLLAPPACIVNNLFRSSELLRSFRAPLSDPIRGLLEGKGNLSRPKTADVRGKTHGFSTFWTREAGVLGMDWSHWRFGVSDWVYEPGSKEHGVSNLSKHIAPCLSGPLKADSP